MKKYHTVCNVQNLQKQSHKERFWRIIKKEFTHVKDIKISKKINMFT
jgi:hypothetical protein